jgi:hypothetical protein
MLGSDVILESHDEAVAMGKRSFGYVAMDFVIVHPPLILSLDLRDPPLGLFHARHGTGFDALDIRGMESIDRLLILALPAQCCHFFSDVYGRHDEFLLGSRVKIIVLGLFRFIFP